MVHSVDPCLIFGLALTMSAIHFRAEKETHLVQPITERNSQLHLEYQAMAAFM